ncbi:MAG: D-alanyl-D-alanine carboxypeptidase, partial [Ignavibacteriaceae bacterium]|nr:D-alanyl-D-alanine carboxypeptidase [Ignavibacteriaceae bacterium]
MKKILIRCFYFSLISASLFAQDKAALRYSIDTLLANDFFASTIAAVSVYDLTANQSIYNRSEKLLLHPASNMKVLTSAAGLIFLGPEYTFNTKLAYTGEIIEGKLFGDLYVIGGMDPDFTSDDIDSLI